ncbi:MAG: hypothetical protein ABH858_04355 [Candidatus Omnitrophota bacterium]
MKNVKFKAFFSLIVLLLLDLSPAAHFLLKTELLLVGIIFLSFYLSFDYVLLLSLFFGMLKDLMMFNSVPIFTLAFIFTVTVIEYLLWYVPKKPLMKVIVVATVISVNIIINSFALEDFSFIFSVNFFIQSFVFFYVFDRILKKLIYR